MPAVLLHGVAETPVVWDPLRLHLTRSDVVALQLPGFGCAVPEGFGATKEEYVAWVAGELERLQTEGPLDVVGHDWGGAFVVRLAGTRGDLLRSWVTDAAGIAHPKFEVARVRQDLADARGGRAVLRATVGATCRVTRRAV